MSFILDALRKAEALRSPAPPVATGDGQFSELAQPENEPVIKPVWIIAALGGVVVIAASAWWLGRSSTPATPASVASADNRPAVQLPLTADQGTREIRSLDSEVRRGQPRPAAQPPNATQSASSTRSANGRITPGTVEVSLTPLERDDATVRTNVPRPTNTNEQLPSYQSLALSGRTTLPPFHLDIHVYSSQPQRRFVFVNNRKYREGEQLEEGGSVERITENSVVLNHRGHRFELFPD